MNHLSRISVDPTVCHGRPTIRGLRYPVSVVLELPSSSMTPQQILADYGDLEPEDIEACIEWGPQNGCVITPPP
jgi:uncharacterized protein (DUF433 family)